MKRASALSALLLAAGLVAGGSPQPATAQPAQNNDALMLLYNQFSDMEAELASLRSMVEEQANEIRRLQRDTRDRYTDLDSRLSSLYQEMAAGSNAGGNTGGAASSVAGASTINSRNNAASDVRAPVNASEVPAPGQVPRGQGQADNSDLLPDPAGMTEQQLYQFALDTLLQNEEYQLSTDAFDLYLDEYPDGRFVTNAWYWKGQALVNLSLLEEARDAFEIIVNDYPDGRKIEDAMYSLGTVYGQLGDTARARELLQEVMNRFPNTSAANLADIYLRSLD
ncbi:MAG: tol-pal system protein YbgF [Pseudohongiellaceae bacterium]